MSRLPDMNAQALAAYEAWCAQQGGDDHDAWADLPAPEQDGWRRAVRLLAVLGRVAKEKA